MTPRRLTLRGVGLRAANTAMESNFSNLKFEYLREKKSLSKTFLTCSLGAQVGSIHEKNAIFCENAAEAGFEQAIFTVKHR